MGFLGWILVLGAVAGLMVLKVRLRRARLEEAHRDSWRFGEPVIARPRSQYQKKFQLLNKSELLLFSRIKEAAPGMLIFSQVSMSQLFFIESYRKDGYRQIGEIGRKSIDFLLCNPDSSIAMAIELNGPTHLRPKQKASDEKKRIALEEAGIPLIVIPSDRIPDVEELRTQISSKMGQGQKAPSGVEERVEPVL